MTSSLLIGTNLATGLTEDVCPFPGLASYDIDHRHSFRGRDDETIEVARMLVGERLSILAAYSGEGKTSLIHAGLAPLLMHAGFEVAVAEPGGQSPVAEIGEQLLARLVPLASENLAPLHWLRRMKGRGSLRKARSLLASQPRSWPCPDSMTSPDGAAEAGFWPSQRPVDIFSGGPLRTWVTDDNAPDHLLNAAMIAVSEQVPRRQRLEWPGVDAPIGDVIRFFESIPPERELARPNRLVHPEAQKKSLLKQLDRAFRYHCRAPGFKLVLFIDQFEELFVQFRGNGSASTSSASGARWQHKEQTLELISEILQRPEWPVRVVLSLRREHFGELDDAFLQGAPVPTYHLSPLHREQAAASLHQLAAVGHAGKPPSKAATATWRRFVAKAVDLLSSGDNNAFVDGTQLSSLGQLLWKNYLPSDVTETVKTALMQQIRPLMSVDEAVDSKQEVILHSSLSPSVRTKVATTLAEQQEALDILTQLRIPSSVGGGGRRLSLPMSALEAPSWRSRSFRRIMINRLRQAKLIRQDKRNEQDYFEIVHERMIDVIEELRQRWKNDLYADLDKILEYLRGVFALDPFLRLRLRTEHYATLDANRQRLDLSDFAASRIMEAMLATDELWSLDENGHCPAASFLQWLAERVDAEGRKIASDVADEGDAVARRALAAWQGDELASPTLVDAAQDRDIGVEPTLQTSWLLLSSLFHGREGEKHVEKLALKLRAGEESWAT